MTPIQPSGVERTFDDEEIIVSKTDRRGVITYANHVFCRVSGYSEADLVGTPHRILRHPDMPRCVFKLLWDTIQSGREIFAYVINMAKNGDHYWVFAHVTPTFDVHGEITGYHSNRRVPDRRAVEAIQPIYAALLAEEKRFADKTKGMASATQMLLSKLSDAGVEYGEFVFSLEASR